MTPDDTLLETPLGALHRELGARMVPFAGYAMPLQYRTGILAEHRHTRESAGLFDVSHMGQVRLSAKPGASMESVARALERLVAADIVSLGPGRQRYTQFTNGTGGILDDLMVTSLGDHLWLVVNAARKHDDVERLNVLIGEECDIEFLETRALLALQGPSAVAAFARLVPESESLSFMRAALWSHEGETIMVSRSGYTGEDGVEVSVSSRGVESLARRLLARDGVEAAGLGARDSLRLEAGLCLHGHDIDTTTTPVEAGLAWSIQKRRRLEGGFPGADVIISQLRDGPPRRRVGLVPQGKAPVREGAAIRSSSGALLGAVTSGAFGPTAQGPIAMGYVASEVAATGTVVEIERRSSWIEAEIRPLPFVPHRYHRS
ncbi:MAG: glycine cleavage system aminomethyltransferase GcvT [bacterium]|nr:glycine cleavage system aminomethyltransferase GcvT [bacterium]MDE0238719.1 glycine cleavage system aminomethyltransferase GcvT [bacterium]MDE0418736.1 glycine cleavage system aminomethyltransferase GcvT [bacterium]